MTVEKLLRAQPGKAWESPPFSVGGQGGVHFTLRLCPGGDGGVGSDGHLSLALLLRTQGVSLTADVELSVLNQATGLPLCREQLQGCALGGEVSCPRLLSHSRATTFQEELLPKGVLIVSAVVTLLSAAGENGDALAALHAAAHHPSASPASARRPHHHHHHHHAPQAAEHTPVPPSKLGGELGALLASGEGADVRLELDAPLSSSDPTHAGPPAETTFRAHRWLLCARSPGLRALLGGGKPVLQLSGCEPRAFRAFLFYLYSDELEQQSPPRPLAAQLLALSQRFEVPRLAALCAHSLAAGLVPEELASVLQLADSTRSLGLRRACFAYLLAHSERVRATPGWAALRGSSPRLFADGERAVADARADYLGLPRQQEAVPGAAARVIAVPKASSGETTYKPRANGGDVDYSRGRTSFR